VSEFVPLGWYERIEKTACPPAFEATLDFAMALVQDRVSGVRLVLPRSPGLVTRARAAGRAAGVVVRAERIGGDTMTLRFTAESGPDDVQRASRSSAWRRLRLWLLRRA
jgi:hypothetical protein